METLCKVIAGCALVVDPVVGCAFLVHIKGAPPSQNPLMGGSPGEPVSMSCRNSHSHIFRCPADGFGRLFEGLVRIVAHQSGLRGFGGASDTPGKAQFRGETSGDGILHR